MGKVIVMEETTKDPVNLIGKMSGVCWNSDVSDNEKNFNRGMDCILANHGRTLEFPQIYLTLEGYSAKAIRELYTHIGGSPTRLQASTRYIDYAKNGFDFVIPPSVKKDKEALIKWNTLMHHINKEIQEFKEIYEIPNEDATNCLPLAMTTKVVIRLNLRMLIDMMHQRKCSRAYWEMRQMMADISNALVQYSSGWEAISNLFIPKCEYLGKCPEKKSCGRIKEE